MKRRAHAKRRDLNEPAIVKALRRAGCVVYLLDGPVDLLVGTPLGKTWLLEVKRGELKPSDRELTPAEAVFFREWPGRPIGVVRCLEEALCVVLQKPCRQLQRGYACGCGDVATDPSWLEEWRAEERRKAKARRTA